MFTLSSRIFFSFILAQVFFFCKPALAQFSSLVYPGENGKLVYEYHANTNETNEANIIADFSNCGYKGGGVALPEVPVKIVLYPQLGDDQKRIQEAIDYVSNLAPDNNGFRGAILLKAGVYELAEKLNNQKDALLIETGGVVLRGEGQGADGTILKINFEEKFQAVAVCSPDPSFKTSHKTRIVDDYIGFGATEFEVENAGNYAVGDLIQVRFTPNQTWLEETYANTYLESGDLAWDISTYTINFERKITGIIGETIVIHSPVILPLQSRYGGGEIHKIEFNSGGRIENIGIENLRIVGTGITPTCAADNPNRLQTAIHFDHIENSWINAVTVLHTSNSLFKTWNSHYITIQDCASLEPLGPKKAGYRYTFYFDAASSHNLCQRTYTYDGRHDYVLGPRIPGPNVFLDGYSVKGGTQGPHQRWAAGTLFDNLKLESLIALEHRGSSGSGHSWAGVQSVIWNTESPTIICDAPAGFMNYAIGNTGTEILSAYINNTKSGVFRGFYNSHGEHVETRSLYLQQLKDRLGEEAVNKITIPEQLTGNIYDKLANWRGEGPMNNNTGISLNAPQDFKPTDYSILEDNKYVVLEWTDIETRESKYIIERSADGGENFEVLAELPENTESFTDTDISQGDYHYRIKAENDNEFSAYNNLYVDLSSKMASAEITFYVDLNLQTDLYEAGKVWVKFEGQQKWQSMIDDDMDKIYTTTVPIAIGKNLKYYFIYQNGPDFSSDFVEEKVPSECANINGFRTLQVPSDSFTLPAVLFNSCHEALPSGIDITDLEKVIISGSNDNEPWINGGEGAGSPPGERIEMLIDNDVKTKYLVRATDSWIEVQTDTLSLLTGYTITSANDFPARDPRNWELLGWDETEQKWILLHEIKNNPPWPDFFTPRSWRFENVVRCKKYRLHITQTNGDSQGLMQISELQLWADLGNVSTNRPELEHKGYRLTNYPNPFNKKTIIQFSIPKMSKVKLDIYDAFGRRIETLIDEKLQPGSYQNEWNATFYPAGIYFYRISIDDFVTSKKLILKK
jgi:hypothetical protein